MINFITTTGRFLTGQMSQGSAPYPTNNHINDGQVRFSNTSGPGFDVCVDGRWQRWNGQDAQVRLTDEAESILMWAQQKMAEESRIKQLAESNPTVADAAEALKRAEEQLRVVMELVQ